MAEFAKIARNPISQDSPLREPFCKICFEQRSLHSSEPSMQSKEPSQTLTLGIKRDVDRHVKWLLQRFSSDPSPQLLTKSQT